MELYQQQSSVQLSFFDPFVLDMESCSDLCRIALTRKKGVCILREKKDFIYHWYFFLKKSLKCSPALNPFQGEEGSPRNLITPFLCLFINLLFRRERCSIISLIKFKILYSRLKGLSYFVTLKLPFYVHFNNKFTCLCL